MDALVLSAAIFSIIGFLFLFLIIAGVAMLSKSKIPYYIGALLAFLYLLVSLITQATINVTTAGNENSYTKTLNETTNKIMRVVQFIDFVFIGIMFYMAFKSDKPSNSNSMSGGKRR
jgi:c-di-AMP phosphodiesterase-like protein